MQVSATQKWTIESFFDEIAENYIQARVPALPGKERRVLLKDELSHDAGTQSTLEDWGKSLNGLTQFNKFRELGTLMYGDPAQGPSIVSRYTYNCASIHSNVHDIYMYSAFCP